MDPGFRPAAAQTPWRTLGSGRGHTHPLLALEPLLFKAAPPVPAESLGLLGGRARWTPCPGQVAVLAEHSQCPWAAAPPPGAAPAAPSPASFAVPEGKAGVRGLGPRGPLDSSTWNAPRQGRRDWGKGFPRVPNTGTEAVFIDPPHPAHPTHRSPTSRSPASGPSHSRGHAPCEHKPTKPCARLALSRALGCSSRQVPVGSGAAQPWASLKL